MKGLSSDTDDRYQRLVSMRTVVAKAEHTTSKDLGYVPLVECG